MREDENYRRERYNALVEAKLLVREKRNTQ